MENPDVGVHAINDIHKWYTLVSCILDGCWNLYSCFLFSQESPTSE
jgi:hypothetical protein